MSRHSKNANTAPFFTYSERKKLKYGTQKQRIGTDSLLRFDACHLCLRSAVKPVATPYGYIYCKECILNNILEQKKQIKRQKKLKEEYEKQEQLEKQLKEQELREKQIQNFERLIDSPVVSNTESKKQTTESGDSCFWIPQKVPDAKPETKKDFKIQLVDPFCGKPLRVKQLIDVQFTEAKSNDLEKSSSTGGNLYMCPCCCKIFSMALKGYVLKDCGHTICQNCQKKFIEKDMICIVCSKKVRRKKDIIKIDSSGTSFAASAGEKAEAKIYTPTIGHG